MELTGSNNSEVTRVNDITETETISAVQTRAQMIAETKSIRPLKHTIIDALNLSPNEFSNLQREDKTLSEYWRLAEISDENNNTDKVQFKIKNDVLYREYQSGPHDDVIEQVIVSK